MSFMHFLERMLYAVSGLAIAGVIAAAAVLLGTWFEHQKPLKLPAPTVAFAVGRRTLHLVHEGLADEFAPPPGSNRELIVWIWYPAKGGGTRTDYLPPAWRKALAASSGILNTDFVTRDSASAK